MSRLRHSQRMSLAEMDRMHGMLNSGLGNLTDSFIRISGRRAGTLDYYSV